MFFEHFSVEGRQVVGAAKAAAEKLHHPKIEPEHLLLALIKTETRASPILAEFEISEAETQERLQALPTSGVEIPFHPFSQSSKAVLTRSFKEAEELGNPKINGEHILLSLARQAEKEPHYLLGELLPRASELYEEILNRSTQSEKARQSRTNSARIQALEKRLTEVEGRLKELESDQHKQ
jgi:ATP-dependent Clp protease ATP-binding subunit ClpA